MTPLVASALAFVGPWLAVGPQLDVESEIDQAVAQALEAWPIEGIGVVAVENGKVLFARGHGAANPDSKFDGSTPIYIASNTKAFTALAVARLVVEGGLSLESPLTEFIPRKYFPANLEVESVNLKQLLGHTHGLANEPLVFRTAHTGDHPEDLRELLRFTDYIGDGERSTQFKYSNVGYLLAGMVLESAAGSDWKTCVRDLVLTDLGMSSTRVAIPKDKLRTAALYEANVPHPLRIQKTTRTLHAAGGLYSTLNDMGRWLAFLTSPKIPSDHPLAECLELYNRPLAEAAEQMGPLELDGYGFGWSRGKISGRPLRFHFGTFSGAESFMSFMPEERTGVFVYVNERIAGIRVAIMLSTLFYDSMNENPAKAMHQELFGAMISEIYADHKSHDLSVAPAGDFPFPCGEFESDAFGTLRIIEKDGQYRLQLGDLASVGYKGDVAGELLVEFIPGTVERFQLLAEEEDGTSLRYTTLDGEEYCVFGLVD